MVNVLMKLESLRKEDDGFPLKVGDLTNVVYPSISNL